MEKPEFLKKSYPELADSEPIKRSVKKVLREDPEMTPEDLSDEDKLNIHLKRIENILKYKNKAKGNNTAVEQLKMIILNLAVIKVYKKDGQENRKLLKEIARNLFKAEKEVARAEGRGAEVSEADEKLGELQGEERDSKLIEIYKAKVIEARNIQEETLSHWMDYLTSGDSSYPTWFKYLIIKAISKLGQLDEEKQEFKRRFPQTLAPFPELDQGALGLVYTHITQNPDEEKDFNALYARFLIQNKNERKEVLSDKGEWEIISQGADANSAMKRLQGYGSPWCIATNLADMERYLKNGDLHIYFSENEKGESVIPRICIYVENGNVKEIRGIAKDQNLEGRMNEIEQERKKGLPGGDMYDKRDADMKLLTEIERKMKESKGLSREELVFLYEIDGVIEGFGYEKDPRIEELLSKRNHKEDAPIVFECRPEEIAWNQNEITEKTKNYIGKLFPGVFQKGFENVYISFPNRKIEKYGVETGGKSKNELKTELKSRDIKISGWTDHLLESEKFVISKNKEKINLVSLTVNDLGFPNGATIEGIFERAKELGLGLCPPEVGPLLRLAYLGDRWLLIGMEPIFDRDGDPNVFTLNRYEGELWLYARGARAGHGWHSDRRFVFRLAS